MVAKGNLYCIVYDFSMTRAACAIKIACDGTPFLRYVINILLVRVNGFFLNAKKNLSVRRIR